MRRPRAVVPDATRKCVAARRCGSEGTEVPRKADTTHRGDSRHQGHHPRDGSTWVHHSATTRSGNAGADEIAAFKHSYSANVSAAAPESGVPALTDGTRWGARGPMSSGMVCSGVRTRPRTPTSRPRTARNTTLCLQYQRRSPRAESQTWQAESEPFTSASYNQPKRFLYLFELGVV